MAGKSRVEWSDLDPLEQIPEESPKANQALFDYAMMGLNRNLRRLVKRYEEEYELSQRGEAAEPPTRWWATIARWSREYAWVARVQAWEDLERKRRIARRRERIEQWEDDAWDLSQQLAGKARQMLKFPLARQEVEDGKTIILPANWNFDTLARALQTADKLARLSTGTETEIIGGLGDWRDALPPGVTARDVEALLEELTANIIGDVAEQMANSDEYEQEADGAESDGVPDGEA
ncbi:MAG: hypothetical protein FOGNACKC_00898 [Anaerolineae bacterium]|nr:hypothetical protein [Anaerolineae bacterium]